MIALLKIITSPHFSEIESDVNEMSIAVANWDYNETYRQNPKF